MGSLYTARLQDSGQGVTILARGQRFAEMRELNHRLAAITGCLARPLLPATNGLDPYW